ncbi:ectoine/hydroxyectoine ABC transporter substrate-binding protein EhuB [Saccharomonospora xinjiangensis]|uniref:ectoine/hydroxyectoine ABC transporter substrate-binding protein EhuB n=1 Tax=Saccharomonospora xinjiangensis TaxID=75294 RepID=UPI00106FFDB8|nr:ectoine/hydroxyectoine ABC transporter substrate-binding protein EhuB [Saccharomonospora xinjiangensis]QBQ61598.1 ABC transporter arginine-binding protein precursor [Saccharomonospora xinjiangensis]
MSKRELNLSRRALLRYSAVGLAAVGGGSLLAACQTTNPETGQVEGSGLQQRIDSGQPVRLAVANEPPYTKLEANGELTGASPDVTKAVLERLGITKVEGIQTDYDSMIPGLDADRWDIVSAGLFMNKTRCAKVLYASPDIVSTESFAVPAGNPKKLTTVDALLDSDAVVAVLAGSYELKTAKALGVPESQLQTYPKAPDAMQGMRDGRVDAVLLPTLTLKSHKEQYGGEFEITEPLESFPTTGAGAAFRKSDADFHKKFDTELKKFKETDEFAQILDKWGFDAKASRKSTTEQLCATEG